MANRYQAEFHPQAWVNDNAIPVDPEGPTTWDCTRFIGEIGATHPGWLVRTLLNGDDECGKDYDDILRTDPAAPEWVREWRGPFDTYLYVEGKK